MRLATLLCLLLTCLPVAWANEKVIFSDDFNDTAYSDANWIYLDDSPDYSGGTAAITSSTSLIIDNTDPFVYAESEVTYTLSQDYVLASDGTATLFSHLSNSSGTDYFTYTYTFDYASDTVTLESDENGTVTTLLTETGDGLAQSGLATFSFTYTPSTGSRLTSASFAGTSYSFDDIKPAVLSQDLTFGIGGTNVTFDNVTLQSIPEPSAGALLGLGGLVALLRRRRG